MANNDRPRILCVDDEPNVLEGLARNLRTHYVVETATEGKPALDMLKSAEPFAVVMSDQRIPQMTGTQFLAQARATAPCAFAKSSNSS
jgi:CheY-like chemotaxis protein